MGRSTPSTWVPNPAKITVEYTGEHGVFRVYDKENKERIDLDVPFRFVWVETMVSVIGFSEKFNKRLVSNELSRTKARTEHFDIFYFEEKNGKAERVTVLSGPYKEIKDEARSLGATYAFVVYAVAKGSNGPIKDGDLIRIVMNGSCRNAWIDAGPERWPGGIEFFDVVKKKKGKTEYLEPMFRQLDVEDDCIAKAVNADKMVQAWIEQAPVKTEQAPAKADEHVDFKEEEEDDIPF